jgi:two-component system, cell cycle response regulator DivK
MISKIKVLIVEDHEVNRALLKSILQMRGYHALMAENAEECMKVAHSEKPDLILMDIGLPDKDGFTVTRELKQDPLTKHIPVIAITAHAFASEKAKALAAGCVQFLNKPVPMNDLIEAIQQALLQANEIGKSEKPLYTSDNHFSRVAK